MKWFVAKRVYLPSLPFTLILLGAAAAILLLFVFQIYKFLATDDFLGEEDRADVETLLVVEGWVEDHIIDATVEEFAKGGYQNLAVTGGPITGMAHILGMDSFAEFGAKRLRERGISDEQLIVAPAFSVDRRRTQRMAMDLRRRLSEADGMPSAINLMTADVHARRSRMIYRRVFGPEIRVGARGIEPLSYDPVRWWNTSAGLKKIVLEVISLVYDSVSPTAE